MNFDDIKLFGSYIGKDYAIEIFKLLVNYSSLSASEAASRLNLHIRTAQDFLEAMAKLNILKKEEVYEKKRPYFRYSLINLELNFNLDFEQLKSKSNPESKFEYEIREITNSPANFTVARNGNYFSTVTVWLGTGRQTEQRKINLTHAQGKFLYNLPFPDSNYLKVEEIANKADISSEFYNEIIDILDLLIDFKVIELKTI